MDAPATIAGVKSWRMTFALLGGAVAWTGHLMISYAVAEFGCVAGLGHRHLLGVTIVSWLLLGVSGLFNAIAAAAVVVSYRIREPASPPPTSSPDPDDRSTREFTASFGLIVNGLFLFIVLVQSVPVFYYWGRC